jgi:hypothetical protein
MAQKKSDVIFARMLHRPNQTDGQTNFRQTIKFGLLCDSVTMQPSPRQQIKWKAQICGTVNLQKWLTASIAKFSQNNTALD